MGKYGKEFSKVNGIQNWAICCFLGVHKFTPMLALQGDMGWEPCLIKQRGKSLDFGIVFLLCQRVELPKKVFNWDKAHYYPWRRKIFF